MAYGRRVAFEELRQAAFGVIAAGWTAIGAGTIDETRLFAIFNSTDKDIYISLDGVTTQIRIAAGSGQIFDLTANKVSDDGLFVAKGTVFYQKQTAMGAPTVGNLWVEVMYATGGV